MGICLVSFSNMLDMRPESCLAFYMLLKISEEQEEATRTFQSSWKVKDTCRSCNKNIKIDDSENSPSMLTQRVFAQPRGQTKLSKEYQCLLAVHISLISVWRQKGEILL